MRVATEDRDEAERCVQALRRAGVRSDLMPLTPLGGGRTWGVVIDDKVGKSFVDIDSASSGEVSKVWPAGGNW